MNLQELIDFHTVGAESCEAYAVTPDAIAAKNKDLTKHYNKRAKWHRDAIETIGNLATQAVFNGGTLQNRVDVAEQRAGELEGLLRDINDAPGGSQFKKHIDAALKPAEEATGSTCNQVREESGLATKNPCVACNNGACIDR